MWWIFVVAYGFVFVCLVYVYRAERRRDQKRMLRETKAGVCRWKNRHYQLCPNCKHPYSEWFTHHGFMYCFLCGPFGIPLFVSEYATHDEWREDDKARIEIEV